MYLTEKTAFSQILATASELYGKPLSKHLVRLYWRILQRFELLDVEKAFDAHFNNPEGGQFFPKPADIIRILEGSGETKALQAWTKVEQAIRQIGIYQTLVFDDPLIHAVLEDMGGWVKLCSMRLDEMPFLARELQKRYMGFVLKPPTRYPGYCYGLIESENGKNGYPIPARVLMGDEVKAKQVLLEGSVPKVAIQLLSAMETALSLPASSNCNVEQISPLETHAIDLNEDELEVSMGNNKFQKA